MRSNTARNTICVISLIWTFGLSNLIAQSTSDPLEKNFLNPPEAARPRVWWHWMNGNITKEGIGLDLDWMKRAGLGGFQNFDAALNTPKVVDNRLVYMDPGWKEAFRFAIEKGKSLGFEMAIAGSPGWSETGGPWVTPEQAMKKYVWSETTVEGGKHFSGILPKPPSVTGPFQTLASQDPMGNMGGAGAHPPSVPDFYKDSVVIAYKQATDDKPPAALKPTVTTTSGAVDSAALWDNDLMTSASITAPTTEPAWIQLSFPMPQTIQSVTFALGGPRNPLGMFIPETNDGPMIEGSEDGTTFSPLVRVPTFGAVQHTLTFPTKTLRAIRVTFAPKVSSGLGPDDLDLTDLGVKGPTSSPPVMVAEFSVHSGARVNRFEDKAAFAAPPDLYSFATGDVSPASAVDPKSVVDLTSKMQPDGSLTWDPPSGKWTIVRMGYSLTGITNHPAPPEATGPEVDKLNKTYVASYMNKYLDNYKDATGGLMGTEGVRYVITDSWEAGTQNWTDDMLAEFQKRRGYSATPYLPVLTGQIVGSAADSDRFLWDFRKTIAELVAENHYGTIAELLHSRGLKVYGESHEDRRATIGDGMEMKRYTDIPMAAMWTRPGEQFGSQADIRESASVAHIYGQNLAAAESLTSSAGPWAWSPAMLKPTADLELASGLNRFVIHESAHQPLVGKAPGLALGPFGQWFNRNEIWAEQATPWINYLARNSYLLQQGRFVADVAYFYGEDSNLTAIFNDHAPDVPSGYNFDYINADALINKLSVKDHNLITPSGMTYRVLVLDPYATHMSLPVLRKLHELAVAGATIYGARPTADPSLGDDAKEYKTVGDQLWNSRGRVKLQVFSQEKLSILLEDLRARPDFEYTKPAADTKVLFVHRHLEDGDLYFLDNRNDRPEQIEATFRVTGKIPEIWHADTGQIEPISYRIEDGRTTVPLPLDAYGTTFVVFRKPASAPSLTLPAKHDVTLAPVKGPWKISFEPNRGAPATTTVSTLASLSENGDTGIRYFSGHATYIRTINAPVTWFKHDALLWLDLGDVANLAEVKINGKPLGIVWKKPFRVDVTSALKPGDNHIEITVANLWVNRLIGDAQPNATTKYTFTTRNPYKANSKLLPSGLIGPVQVMETQVVGR
ncbi:glycosyl hydrolase [Granulicella sp. dw_53]|uniref:glycosyl hydrolase n=1 Tax=Granulicella sp. dw_53 TaxID=2719792 RepID=UPI001BD64008|nr:glycosyl hydrolase [Granulicella sp. dw_53]